MIEPFDWRARCSRYLHDAMPTRLGNLASNLARIAACAERGRNSTLPPLLRETQWFIEWTGPELALSQQMELVQLQIELARWQLRCRAGADGIDYNGLAQIARTAGTQALAWSGLSDPSKLK